MIDAIPRRRFFSDEFSAEMERLRKERQADYSAQERAHAAMIDLQARRRAKEAADEWDGPAVFTHAMGRR